MTSQKALGNIIRVTKNDLLHCLQTQEVTIGEWTCYAVGKIALPNLNRGHIIDRRQQDDEQRIG